MWLSYVRNVRPEWETAGSGGRAREIAGRRAREEIEERAPPRNPRRNGRQSSLRMAGDIQMRPPTFTRRATTGAETTDFAGG